MLFVFGRNINKYLLLHVTFSFLNKLGLRPSNTSVENILDIKVC